MVQEVLRFDDYFSWKYKTVVHLVYFLICALYSENNFWNLSYSEFLIETIYVYYISSSNNVAENWEFNSNECIATIVTHPVNKIAS